MNPELWHQPWLALLSWLPVPFGAALLAAPAWPAGRRLLDRPAAGALVFVLTRLVFAGLVFGALGHRSLDLVAFHAPQARAVLAGQVPYRDFVCLYAPGFPYLLAAAVALSAAWGPLVLFVLADLGAFLALARAHGHARPAPDSPAWLYLAFPPVWYFEVRYAQDETLGALFLALGMLALARRRGTAAGVALVSGQLLTKPLFGVGALPLLLPRGALRSARIGFALPLALAYAALTLAGIPWWRDLGAEASAFGVGPVLWRLPVLWWGLELGRWGWAPEAALGLAGLVVLRRRGASGVELAAWAWGCHALLAPKLLPMYVVLVAPVLAAWAARSRERLGWWAIYGVALGTAWYADSGPLQGLLGGFGVALGAAGVLLPAACAAWLLACVWRGVPHARGA